MTPAGYLAKKIEICPSWLKADSVQDIYSLSGCISEDFCDYITHWKHNGFWLFDSPEKIAEVAKIENIDLSEHRVFYYEVYEKQFNYVAKNWELFELEKSFETLVLIPREKTIEGFDVVNFSARTSPECSPLSCNSLAETVPVNTHCLLGSLDEAIRLVEEGAFENSEPGPYRIFAVYSCDLDEQRA